MIITEIVFNNHNIKSVGGRKIPALWKSWRMKLIEFGNCPGESTAAKEMKFARIMILSVVFSYNGNYNGGWNHNHTERGQQSTLANLQ